MKAPSPSHCQPACIHNPVPTSVNALQISGIAGVTFLQSDVVRVSGTKVTVKLTFDGTDFDTDATLTFTVGDGCYREL